MLYIHLIKNDATLVWEGWKMGNMSLCYAKSSSTAGGPHSGLKLKRQRMREKENIKDIEIIEKSMGF